jgi:TolB-like protein
VLLLLSENSLASRNVAKELSVAAELDKRIIPVELGKVKLTGDFLYHLSGLQRTNIANIDSIINAVKLVGVEVQNDVEIVYQPAGYTPPAEPKPRPSNEVPRLAVLLFEDQSPQRDNEWFSEGLTDELISRLSKLEKLFVVDRLTSREYKGTKLNAKQIAEQLGVRYIVSGSVRKAGVKIRVQADLIDTEIGKSIWDEKFDGTMDDIFEIQEKTALDITEGLQISLTPKEEAHMEKRHTEHPQAYEIYLRARLYHLRYTEANLKKALVLYEDAVAIDPNFALAYSWYALCYTAYISRFNTPPEYKELAESLAQTALRVDPNLADAYLAICDVYGFQGRHEESIEASKKAIAVDPNSSKGYFSLGWSYMRNQMYTESAESFEKGLEIEPREPLPNHVLINVYRGLGDEKKLREHAARAIPVFEQLMVSDPGNTAAYGYLYGAYSALKDYVKVKEFAQKMIDDDIKDANILYNVACDVAMSGDTQGAINTLRRIELLPERLLEHSKVDTDFDSIRDLPEYKEIFANWEKKLAESTGG